MMDIIMKLNQRIKFHEERLSYMIPTTEEMHRHEERLSYMIPTTEEMHRHEGAIIEIKGLIEYLEQNYDMLP